MCCPLSVLSPLLFSFSIWLAFSRKVPPYDPGPARGFFPIKVEFFLATVWLKGFLSPEGSCYFICFFLLAYFVTFFD